MNEPEYSIRLDDLLAGWVPGSFDQPWTWDDEERHLLSQPCPTEVARSNGVEGLPDCHDPEPGCYQRDLEAWLRERGEVPQPVLLGPDGRVWDGHHRIVAARRLGFAWVPLEEPVPATASTR